MKHAELPVQLRGMRGKERVHGWYVLEAWGGQNCCRARRGPGKPSPGEPPATGQCVAVTGILQPGICVVVRGNMHLRRFLLALHFCKRLD